MQRCTRVGWIGLSAALLLLSAFDRNVQAEWQVWTTTGTRRVLRSAMPEATKQVELHAARNEVESFQVLVRSDQPVEGVVLVAADLIGPQKHTLSATDARLYRQHQIQISVPTYRNENFRPDWYPDPLIPATHPITRKPLVGGRFQAMPYDLPADQTQGFWVDVVVPPGTPPGQYRGDYRLRAADGREASLPVVMTVWELDLPPTSTLQTALGSPAARMRGYYRQRAAEGKETEPEDWSIVDHQCAELVSRHRINATPPPGSLMPVEQADGSFAIPGPQIEAFAEFVDRYHVNAYCTPHPRVAVKDPVAQRERLHRWLAAWDRAAEKLDRPQVTFYTYLLDEPNDPEAYEYVQQWGKAIKQANSVVKVLVVEQTWPQDEAWGDLYTAVDIWCPLFSLFKPESAAKRQALGETVWTYTALCQRDKTPWWHIDFPLLHYRVPAWIAWRYRLRGLLYWGGMSFWKQVDDPWTDAGTLDRRNQRADLLFNGEGSIVYPARAVGYEGIAPSLRLKALRDSIEDYEYLAMAERAGKATEAEAIVVPLAGSWYTWEPNPAKYEEARRKLAALLLDDE